MQPAPPLPRAPSSTAPRGRSSEAPWLLLLQTSDVVSADRGTRVRDDAAVSMVYRRPRCGLSYACEGGSRVRRDFRGSSSTGAQLRVTRARNPLSSLGRRPPRTPL